jgi:hypothetical protein
MKNRMLGMLAAGIVAAMALNLSTPILADDGAAPPATAKATEKGKFMPYRGKISAVDKTAKTITLGGKGKERVFQVAADTRILKDGQPATLDDVQVGEQARGQARLSSQGNHELISLYLGPKGDETKGTSSKATPAQPSK